MQKKIFIIHENDEWTLHLTQRLDELKLPYESWHLDRGLINLGVEPPAGIFYNRMSASSHTRGHRYAPEFTSAVIGWLEFYGRKVINGSTALSFEINKVKQYLYLEKAGIKTPKTMAALGKEELVKAAENLNVFPFISKHNRAGKGLGVKLFRTIEEFNSHVNSDLFEESVDGITLLQQYIKSPESCIIRNEFIGGKYLYSVRVDTSAGFELCPADACQIGDSFCPIATAPDSDKADSGNEKFNIIENPDPELIAQYEKFLEANAIDVAGIEFISDEKGKKYTYDINTNTNYNAQAETKAGVFAMLELAKYLGSLL